MRNWIITHITLQTAKEFKIEDAYEKDWPIREGYKLHLKYTSDYAKKKVVRKAKNGLPSAARAWNLSPARTRLISMLS